MPALCMENTRFFAHLDVDIENVSPLDDVLMLMTIRSSVSVIISLACDSRAIFRHGTVISI